MPLRGQGDKMVVVGNKEGKEPAKKDNIIVGTIATIIAFLEVDEIRILRWYMAQELINRGEVI